MLTKGDLLAIQKMFDSSKKETNKKFKTLDERFKTIDERFDTIDGRFNMIDERFKTMDEKFNTIGGKFKTIDERFDMIDEKLYELSASLQRNTDDLVELITIGFNTQHSNFTDHEQRITRLEKTTSKPN